jgi:uncharacterized protein (TIGR03435 family)
MLMLQSLLEERFQLTMHRETKELPIYTLAMANKVCRSRENSRRVCRALLTQLRRLSGRRIW